MLPDPIFQSKRIQILKWLFFKPTENLQNCEKLFPSLFNNKYLAFVSDPDPPWSLKKVKNDRQKLFLNYKRALDNRGLPIYFFGIKQATIFSNGLTWFVQKSVLNK